MKKVYLGNTGSGKTFYLLKELTDLVFRNKINPDTTVFIVDDVRGYQIGFAPANCLTPSNFMDTDCSVFETLVIDTSDTEVFDYLKDKVLPENVLVATQKKEDAAKLFNDELGLFERIAGLSEPYTCSELIVMDFVQNVITYHTAGNIFSENILPVNSRKGRPLQIEDEIFSKEQKHTDRLAELEEQILNYYLSKGYKLFKDQTKDDKQWSFFVNINSEYKIKALVVILVHQDGTQEEDFICCGTTTEEMYDKAFQHYQF